MYITSDQHTKLANGLFDKLIEFKKAGEKRIKAYEVAFQDIIEEVFPDKCWYEITKCDIYMDLMEHRDPEKTAIKILKELMEAK